MMDLDSFLVSLYVLVDDWWKADHPSTASRKPGRPVVLSESEVLTLAILAQWPRFRSERDFWRFASLHLRPYYVWVPGEEEVGKRLLDEVLHPWHAAYAEWIKEEQAPPEELQRMEMEAL